MIVGFALAIILNKGVYLKNTLRATVFLPYVSNMVAIAIVFKVMLGSNSPLIKWLESVGFEPPLLLQDLQLALPTVASIAVWKSVGLNMVVYLGALQGVPTELVEAAQIDGATKWQRIRHVIIPLVSPTTFFLLISSIIGSLQNFTVIQVLTEGGPGQATNVMSVNIVRTAFMKYNTSMASAMAMVMFVIVLIITLVQWRGQKKWVNY
jgi:multiple sugar transport system permease protein